MYTKHLKKNYYFCFERNSTQSGKDSDCKILENVHKLVEIKAIIYALK